MYSCSLWFGVLSAPYPSLYCEIICVDEEWYDNTYIVADDNTKDNGCDEWDTDIRDDERDKDRGVMDDNTGCGLAVEVVVAYLSLQY